MSPFNEHQLIGMQSDNLMHNTMITPSIYEYPTFIENYSTGPVMMNNSSSQVSLSEASVCSSMDIRTPDIHPAADNNTLSVTQATCYSMTQHQQWNHDPVVVWPMSGINRCLSYPSIKTEYDTIDSNVIYGENTNSSSSMRKSSHNRRNTVSLPLWYDNESNIKQEEFFEEKELRRQSMNDSNNFCHLTREQLIQRVVQLEKEKQLSACNHIGSISPVLGSTTSTGLDHSDQDDIHPCLWTGCDTSAISLDQLISHIRDIHIGSGKAAYYCEWSCCSRNQKPFLKRHKMQNHMRTHTGERPFECHIDECDKKFSRPDSLNTHIKTHSSIRPYACPIENCGKAYFHSRSLRKHAKSHEPTHSLSPPHPYSRSLKPNKFYQLEETPTTNITPMQQQQIPYSTFYADVKIMDNFEQQQQQIFAAGTAYYSPVQQQQYVSNNQHVYDQLMEPY